jgi:hypothetical protein
MRGANTAGGFNHRRHDVARRELQELSAVIQLNYVPSRNLNGDVELRGGGFMVTFREAETVQVVFVWADSVAQARHKAAKYCTLVKVEEVVARPTGLTSANRAVGLIQNN